VAGEVRVQGEATTGPDGSESSIRAIRVRGRNEIHVTGRIPLNQKEPTRQVLSVEAPERYAGLLFRRLLTERGVAVRRPGVLRRQAPASVTEVGALASPPLSEILALLNKPSDNLIAEMLLKELGYLHSGRGSAAAGGQAVTAWLQTLGVPPAGLRVADGSGLSRHDLVTTRLVSDLLLRAEREPWRAAFLASLPVGGVDGTLRLRMRGTPAANQVRAKTGTLANVSALSGYVTTAGGRRLVFSIVTNHHGGPVSAKRVEDNIAAALAGATDTELRVAAEAHRGGSAAADAGGG